MCVYVCFNKYKNETKRNLFQKQSTKKKISVHWFLGLYYNSSLLSAMSFFFRMSLIYPYTIHEKKKLSIRMGYIYIDISIRMNGKQNTMQLFRSDEQFHSHHHHHRCSLCFFLTPFVSMFLFRFNLI